MRNNKHTADKLTCPKCGSEQVSVELLSAGTSSTTNYYRTGVKKSWFFPVGQKTHRSQRNYKSIALCQKCGHHWEVGSNEIGCLFRALGSVVIFLICIFIALIISWVSSNSGGSGTSTIEDSETSTIEDDGTSTIEDASSDSVWASSYTPLEEFDYYIDSGAIYLKKYTGDSKKIYIASSYTVDDRTLPVVALVGSMFFPNVDSIIISEGVSEIAYAAFNSCGVDYLYIPSTVTAFSGWNFFHDVEKIYYGGSEEDWSVLFTGNRASLDVVEVVCDSNVEDLISEQ